MRFISENSLSAIISRIQNKEISPEDLIEDLCNKLEKWDLQINAFLPEPNRRKRLQQDLKKLYQKFPNPGKRPVLFGIPIGIKDIFHVDGFETKAGSNLPSKTLTGKEAEVVSKLKQAGALILGKTVTTEFAYFSPGPTCNPHNFDYTPGGSSSGSAAAIAAGFCALALGSQTIGSINRPAAFCGIVGFKPSFGRISTKGVIPFSPSADHIGFFTQDLEGNEIIASIICDNWKKDFTNTEKKPILGIPEGKYLEQASPEIISAFLLSIEKLKERGFIIKSIPAFSDIDIINNQHKLMVASEFADVHKNWFKEYENNYHQPSIDLINEGRQVSEQVLKEAKKGRFLLREKLEQLQMENSFDFWISPSSPTTVLKGLDSTGDPKMNLPWTYAGIPTLTIPYGKSSGMPFGMQFAGKYNKDETLFQKLNCLI